MLSDEILKRAAWYHKLWLYPLVGIFTVLVKINDVIEKRHEKKRKQK